MQSGSPVDERKKARSKPPMVLLLGNVDHEGVTHFLKSAHAQYTKKRLDSKPDNWRLICRIFDLFAVKAVVINLGYVRDAISKEQYEEFLEDRRGSREEIHDEVTRANQTLRHYSLDVIPYRTNAEVTVIATQVLRDALEDLIFRIYVPAGRLWASEIDKLLELFRDYLLSTGRKGIRFNQTRTEHGVSYEFHGDEMPISQDFQDFSRLLELCLTDPTKAEDLLKEKDIEPKQIIQIVARYTKEARRLQVDFKHERERRLLSLRQQLESELADVVSSDAEWNLIDQLV